jgi:hypothetical protein
MDRYQVPNNALTKAWQRRLYLAIIMDRYEDPNTALIIVLN